MLHRIDPITVTHPFTGITVIMQITVQTEWITVYRRNGYMNVLYFKFVDLSDTLNLNILKEMYTFAK